jgi:hypothetical protein
MLELARRKKELEYVYLLKMSYDVLYWQVICHNR